MPAPNPKRAAKARRGNHPATRRIAAFIDDRFDGNIRFASHRLGVSYNVLRAAYLGHTRRPSIELALALSHHSDKPLQYWLGITEEPNAVPETHD